MRSREFDEKERLLKANEKLTKYKTDAGADAAAADASGNFARGNTRFKGINRATKKQFANDAKLSQLKEFAPSDDGEGPDSDEVLRRIAAHWWNGTEQQMIRAEQTLAAMGWEIGEDDGYDDGGVFVVRAGDEHGRSYISWPHEELELNEVAPPGAKAERMIRHIKQGYARDGKLTPREKGIAFATAWKAHNAGQVEEQGMAEGSGQKPTITYKDYTLQYDYQTEDDDPEGYSTATTYYFDVLKDGDRVGEAEYFDYFGNLTIRINGKTKEFGFRHPLASQISQLVSSLPDEQKKDLSDPKFESQGVAEGADDKFSVADKVEELVDQYRLYDKRGWADLFAKLAGRKLDRAEIIREMEYASNFLQLLDSIRMRSDYRGQQDPKLDQELIDLSNQWLSLFNKATNEFKTMSGQGVAEGYTGRETKAGTWRVFKDGNAVAAAGPFKSADEAAAWIKKHKQGITEMDKSEPSAGRDTGPRPGPDRAAKPIAAKKATKDAADMLNRAVKDAYKKKDVKEATDSATSNLIWTAMNYLPHDRPKDMEDILVQIAHNQGPVTRATDDPKKLASLVQMVWMDNQARKQKAGQQLDELSIDTLRNYMRAQPARIKGPAGLATTNPKKAARIVDPEKGDMRRALTRLKDPAYGQQGVAEDSLVAMRRLAGIVTPPPAVVSNGPRQYRHMPTAVQPR